MERDVEQMMAVAKGWIAGARWRTVSHRYGVKGRGFVRVASNPPVEALAEVLEVLSGEEGCREMFCDGKPVVGEWKARRAWYEEVRSEDGLQAIGLRVCQLVGDAGSEVEGPYVLSSGCWELGEHAFYFDQAAVAEAPAGESGITYRLEGVRRDSETGLWSWVLVKRVRARVDVEAWLNARTIYTDTRRAQMFGVRQVVKETVVDEEGVSREVDRDVDEQIKAFAAEQGMVLKAGGGKTVQVDKRKSDDCTTDVTLENGEELAVENAEVSTEKSSLSTETRTVDRNQAAAGTAPTAAVVGTVKRVRSVQTPGGRYDVETVERKSTAVASGAADQVCAKTIFEHTDRKTARNQSNPTREATTAGSGKTYEQRVRLNEDGTFDVESETRTEVAVENAEVSTEKSSLSTETRTVDRNQDKAGTAPSAAVVGTVKRVRSVQTPGGRYDVETVERKSTAVASGAADQVCAKTIFEHTDRKTARNQSNPTREATTAGSGKTYEQRVRLNEDGTFDVESETREEVAVENAEVTVRKGVLSDAKVVLDRNATAASTLVLPVKAANEVQATLEEAVSRQTPGGRYDVQTVTRRAFKQSITLTPKADPNGTTHQIIRFQNWKQDEVKALAKTYQQVSCSMNEFGLYDGQASMVTHAEGTRRARTTRDIRTYGPITDSATTGRIMAVGSKIYKVTITESTIEGVLNDNAQAAYEKVKGCANRKVQHLGAGYYSYFGVTNRTETWEQVGDTEDGTATNISGSWGDGGSGTQEGTQE